MSAAPQDPDTVNAAPAPEAPPMAEQERMVEALLFASAEPLSINELTRRLPAGSTPLEALRGLKSLYRGRGVALVQVGDLWAFRTAPDLGHLMVQERVETRKLSRAAIETLAIIAYHQPVTRAEVEEIRGVAVSRGTLDQLMEIGWIRLGRRRMTPGRPVTFVVTDAFLDHFGLESARDLPGLKDLRAAGLLENRPMPTTPLSAADDDEGLAPEELEAQDDDDAYDADVFADAPEGAEDTP